MSLLNIFSSVRQRSKSFSGQTEQKEPEIGLPSNFDHKLKVSIKTDDLAFSRTVEKSEMRGNKTFITTISKNKKTKHFVDLKFQQAVKIKSTKIKRSW